MNIPNGSRLAIVLAFAALGGLMFSTPVKAQDYQQQIDRLAEDIAVVVTKFDLKSVAVLDFVDLKGNTQELGRLLAEELTTSLVLKDRSFKTIDRANLRSILHEQKLSLTGAINQGDTKKLKISGVDGLIRGTITPIGESIRITLQVITVENANIVGGARGAIPKNSAFDSLGTNLDVSTNSPLDGKPSGSSSQRPGKNAVFQDKDLRVTLKYFRKASDERIKAILLIENLRATTLSLTWKDVQVVDDQGDQWRGQEYTGLAGFFTTIAQGAPLTALVVFRLERGTGKATRFNLVGSIDVSDNKEYRSLSYVSFSDIQLGI